MLDYIGMNLNGTIWKVNISDVNEREVWKSVKKTGNQRRIYLCLQTCAADLFARNKFICISAWNALLDQKRKLNISWKRKPFKNQRVAHSGVFFTFHSNLRVFSTSEKEIMNVLTAFFVWETFFSKKESNKDMMWTLGVRCVLAIAKSPNSIHEIVSHLLSNLD